jgi:hypothetical protein
MKPRKHIHVKYWDHCNGLPQVMRSEYQRTITLAGKSARLPRGWNIIFISRNMIFVLCDHVFWFSPIVQSN